MQKVGTLFLKIEGTFTGEGKCKGEKSIIQRRMVFMQDNDIDFHHELNDYIDKFIDDLYEKNEDYFYEILVFNIIY